MTTYHITVDRSLCAGFGSCARLAPETLELDHAGLVTLRVAETSDPRVLDAAAACPMAAIAVMEAKAA
jgi:ferredoxin